MKDSERGTKDAVGRIRGGAHRQGRLSTTDPKAKVSIPKALEVGTYILCAEIIRMDQKVSKSKETLTKEETDRLVQYLAVLAKVGPAARVAVSEMLGLDGLEALSDSQLEALEIEELGKSKQEVDDDD